MIDFSQCYSNTELWNQRKIVYICC